MRPTTVFRAFCLAVLTGVWAGGGLAQEGSPPSCGDGEIAVADACVPDADVAARIDGIVRAAMAEQGLKAVLAGVAVDGRTAVLDAWGISLTGVPATPDMHFRNGAVAISYLGTVLLQLVGQGVVGLDDPLSTWFPDHPQADRVTLRMLITCTSGYADYVTDDGFLQQLYADPFRAWRPEELIAIGLARPMACDPGTCWAYAHTNFVILGRVLEQATGRPLDALIRDGVLDPLGLADTRSEPTALIQPPVLHAFSAERGRYEETTYWDPSWTIAEGSVMTSNIADILTSARAVGEGSLLSPESHALQLAPGTAMFAPWNDQRFYGFGVFVINGWIVQNPSFSGYAATMAYLPSRKLAIAVSVTLEDGSPVQGNASTDVLKTVAALLAPEAPL
jgi:CubicO group peptidase (beta-lactamase class C family)